MNQTDEMKKTLDGRLKEELRYEIDRARNGYEKAKAEFLKRADLNPAAAIEWYAEAMVNAQAAHEVWMKIEAGLEAGVDPKTVLEKAKEDIAARVRSFFGSNSTSLFHNAESRSRAEAELRAGDDVMRIAKHFGL